MANETEQDVMKSVLDQTNIRFFSTTLFPENADILKHEMTNEGWTIVDFEDPRQVIAFKEEVAA